jgi:hypothetical protein
LTHACQLKDFSSQVLEDGGGVDGSLGADAHLALGVGLEEALDTTAGELETEGLAVCCYHVVERKARQVDAPSS